nr:ribonuclease H-like domain-containing protein [Tanacetum cinerariifolium]
NLHAYFAAEGIQHQMLVARTPEQNGIVERRNRTLVEAARTMLSAAKKMASAHNSSDPAPTCQKMASAHNSSDPVPTCPKMASAHNSSDPAPTCQKMASAHNSSDPAPICQKMTSAHNSSDPVPTCPTMALEHDSLSPGRKCQENVSHGDKTVTTSNELDLLFSPVFDELLNGSTKVVSKSSAVSAADAPNQRQQPTTPLNNHSTPAPTFELNPKTSRKQWQIPHGLNRYMRNYISLID